MWTIPRPRFRLLTSFLLATSAVCAWSQGMERAQLEPSASILLRDVAAELCTKAPHAGTGVVAKLSPAAGARLQNAGTVIKSLGYAQDPGITELEEQLRSLPVGPDCRAEVLSRLWQHFTSRGRQQAAPDTGAEADPIALPGVGWLPRLPGPALERKVKSGDPLAAAPIPPAQATTAASPTSTADTVSAPRAPPLARLEMANTALGDERADAPSGDAMQHNVAIAAKPVNSPPPDARGPSADAHSTAPGQRQASDAAATSPRAASSIEAVPSPSERVKVIRGQRPWLALVLMAIVLGPLWLRRTKKLTSAQQARQRLRPS